MSAVPDGVVYSMGETDAHCIYDFALVLSVAQDTIAYDVDSDFGRVFRDLVNSAFASLPDTLIISFRE